MNDWEMKQIKNLGRIVTGKTPPTNNLEYFGGNELFVSPKDLDWNSHYITETETRITSKALEKFKNQVIPRNTVMFTSLSFAFGKMGIASKPCLTNQQINSVIVNKENSSKFVYYLLRAYEPIIFSYNSGIDTPIVPKSVFEKIEVKIPSKKLQEKIAAILSTYDELIENNQRRIALLEKMAEEIYREWFVRLRFPGHEKVKKIKGVPEGWQRTKVVTLTSYLKRGVAPQYDDLAEGFAINQKCIRDGKLDLSFARHQSRDVSADRQIRFGDVLVNSTGEGTLGRVAQVLTQLSNCIVDSHVTIVRPKHNVPIHYFGMTLKAWEVHFSTMGRGATNQTELSPTVIGNIEVTMPSKSLQDVFESHAKPLFAQITYLAAQNERLTRTRDLLLPRLISGKLSVEHLDIQFPPGMEDHP